MTDWPVTAAQIATAAGTLVLAGATFSAIRAGQRSARATEAALLSGIRPVLVGSRVDDPPQKVGFQDDHWVHVKGGHATADISNEAIYLVMSIRNAGNGLAVLDRWQLVPDRVSEDLHHEDVANYRRLTRDIYVPAGEIGFWQGALRDPSDPLFGATRQAIEERRPLTIDLLYGDFEGGQRTVSRFSFRPIGESEWMATVGRHWSLDRPDPR